VPRYVVIGAGAVGITLAAELQAAGKDVVLAARGTQLAELQAGRFTYIRPTGTRSLTLPAVGSPTELALSQDDVLVLATKTQDADAALADWAWQPVSLAGGSSRPAAAVLPLITTQNGLDAERAALRRFATVLAGVIWVAATYVRTGEVVTAGGPAVGVIWLGAYPDRAHPGLAAIAGDLSAAGFLVEVVDDISRWKAAKLLASVTFALDALYEPGDPRADAATLLREEARHILTAAGQGIADAAEEATVDFGRFVADSVPGHERGTSSWQSLTRSGSLESDFLNGEIVLTARLLGLRAPANEAVLERIRSAARAGTRPRSLPPADLLATLPVLARAPAVPRDVLIDVKTLHDLLALPAGAAGKLPAVLDVRWALGDSSCRARYRAGHIPGAVFADLDAELAAPPSPEGGRHPLPPVAELQRAARSWGLREGQPVVVYDDSGGLAAARAWWLLRWAGIASVRILDGALAAWHAAGFDLETGQPAPEPGDVTLRGGHLPVVSADQAAAIARDGLLLDARAVERYRGEVEPVDSRGGHVPGAISAPAGANLSADGTFAPPRELRLRYAALGAAPGRPVAVYCGSGVTAAHDIAALTLAGVDAALFPGSWSAWSADPQRPVATGPAPG
jgi:thiosulfate/3-mercaptopyruvate sulfurtransferase